MTTIEDHPPRTPLSSHARTRSRSPRRGRFDLTLLAWPIGLLILISLIAVWRWGGYPALAAAPRNGAEAATDATQLPVELRERRFGELRIDVPATWGTLSRSKDHISWGTADRSHTVTVASIEASVLPLAGVVDASIRETEQQLPQAQVVGRAEPLKIEDPFAAREDAALLARFGATSGDGSPLEVVQIWRRDARSERDLIATWTSADGQWPVTPAQGMPRTRGAGGSGGQ